MQTKLSTAEISLYFVIWVLTSSYSLYKLYEVQTELLGEYSDIQYKFKELKPSWKVLSRLKDVSDFEWSSWKFLFYSSWQYFIIHFIVAELLRKCYNTALPYWYILGSVIYTSSLFGAKHLMSVVSQPIIFSALIYAGGTKLCIWILSILIMLTVNYLKYVNIFWDFFDNETMGDEEIYLLITGLGWIELRCISYCLNYINEKEKKAIGCQGDVKNKENLLKTLMDIFSYVLYMPTLYTGPIILYEEYEISFQRKNHNVLTKLQHFVKDMGIYIIYTLLLDLAFHYIYFFAMQDDIEVIRKMPSIALCGGGLWMGLQFQMKYVISYGTIGAFVKLDNIEPPPTPRCIARIHVYSQMWRYFDVGFYRFLIQYIYKPMIGLISPEKFFYTNNKQIASLMTFVFIFIWHGSTLPILVWAILNYIGITLEHLGALITKTDGYIQFKAKVLKSDQMEQRFKALVCVPLFAMSAISSFYLFGGSEIGNLFFEYFNHPSWYNAIIITVALYSCCHVSVALQDVPSRTDRKCLKVL